MNISDARNYRMTFGRHCGFRLDDIARTPKGLEYLEWMVGRAEYRNGLQDALKVFLGYPEIAKKVRKLHERDRR